MNLPQHHILLMNNVYKYKVIVQLNKEVVVYKELHVRMQQMNNRVLQINKEINAFGQKINVKIVYVLMLHLIILQMNYVSK